MTASKDDVIRTALMLPETERADLIAALIESPDASVEADAEEAWRTEITRRAAEHDSGAVQSIPWDLVKRRLAHAPKT